MVLLWCHYIYHKHCVTFISVDSFQIHTMSDDVVFIWDSISSEHISCNSSYIQGLATWVSLDHWDHFWCCPISKTPNYVTLVVYKCLYEIWICILACSTHFPSSFSLPTCKQACRPIEISVNMSAIFFCGSWFLASGFPNCILEDIHHTSNIKFIQSCTSFYIPQCFKVMYWLLKRYIIN